MSLQVPILDDVARMQGQLEWSLKFKKGKFIKQEKKNVREKKNKGLYASLIVN